jgi:N-acetylglucosaminyldiphosphoundecaprenol N-acetyl-beta-D-mannosaminyltransferase
VTREPQTQPAAAPVVSFLGVKVHAVTMPELNDRMRRAIETRQKMIVANHNTHSVYLYHHDERMRSLYEHASLCHVDGMALIFIAKVVGKPLERRNRITYVDWLPQLMAEANRNCWRIFYLGSKPDVLAEGVRRLRTSYPDVVIESHHGYFDPSSTSSEALKVVGRINGFKPDLLMVGMGMPRQEHWILDHFEVLDVSGILCAGACLDYVAGHVPTPPRWMGRIGLEWLHRLANDPRRLWRRYLIEPWYLGRKLIGESWKRRDVGR